MTTSAAKHIFLWSRLRTLKDRTERAEIRLRHGFFTDFLEALVRLSMMCSLPTQMDLEEAGAADAGEYLLGMQAKEPKAYARFLRKNRPKFTDPDGSDYEKHALQPVEKCVEHLIKLLVKTVEHSTSAKNDTSFADGVIQQSEAAKFLKLRALGTELHLEHAAASMVGVDFAAAMENATLKLAMTAAAIKIQMMKRLKDARGRMEKRRREKEQAASEAAEAAGEEAPCPAPSD